MSPKTLASAVAALLTLQLAADVRSEVTCAGAPDGLHVDYESGCHDYVRCDSGRTRATYSCERGRAFSGAVGACVPRSLHPCVKRSCAPKDSSAYAAPGTGCREYYRCENGTARDFACPPGTWFDLEQGCTRGAGACYEPLCGGLPDGYHADPSHECRRRLRCRGGELRALVPCSGGDDRCPRASDRCPPPRSAAFALPVGDAHFCSDEECSSLCQLEEDGTHADRASGCREYYECAGRRLVGRGVCEPGKLFSSAAGSCVTEEAASCPPAVRGRCFTRADGLYRDWRDCRSWFACRRERVVARGSCDAELAWDGAGCVPSAKFYCVGPEPTVECATRPSGFYQDLASDCARYFHCEGTLRTELSCGNGMVFDGASCVREGDYLCPSLDRYSCYGKSDGLYRARAAGCRGHYACAAGTKSWRVCAPGLAFDEVERACVEASRGVPCPVDESCFGRTNGYHADETTGCRDYFVCEDGERLATLTCFASRLYDGKRCVEPSKFKCGTNNLTKEVGQYCADDGFEVVPGSKCSDYAICTGGARAILRCPRRQLFNGQVCISEDSYTCPEG